MAKLGCSRESPLSEHRDRESKWRNLGKKVAKIGKTNLMTIKTNNSTNKKKITCNFTWPGRWPYVSPYKSPRGVRITLRRCFARPSWRFRDDRLAWFLSLPLKSCCLLREITGIILGGGGRISRLLMALNENDDGHFRHSRWSIRWKQRCQQTGIEFDERSLTISLKLPSISFRGEIRFVSRGKLVRPELWREAEPKPKFCQPKDSKRELTINKIDDKAPKK